jgi:flavin-dependent dehydrogenase
MSDQIKKIIIVGGGTAGWITAGIIAAEHIAIDDPDSIEICVIESPSIQPIGVGEGTWPSMRLTLKALGISEDSFLTECDASFKQGSKFIAWQHGNKDTYYHPFTLPNDFYDINLAKHWLKYKDQVNFSKAVSIQESIAEHNLAPKKITTPEYSFIANYGYHLDAGKFSPFIAKHCMSKLGVTLISDNITQVNSHNNGDIKSVSTEKSGDIAGDLFIDCSGLHGLLLDKHFNIPFVSQKHILFNDSALAVQLPYQSNQETISSATLSTATKSGWVWDIGLQSRRGVGHVYSSAYTSDQEAETTLREYIEPTLGKKQAEQAAIRKLNFEPGHRKIFWHKNCVAVGMSAGFIEPLEASAIALVEQSAKMISEQLPQNRAMMDITAQRFNNRFQQHWQQIIEFLKLHYVMSKRTDSNYWLDNRSTESIPDSLKQKLELWQFQAPYNYDSSFSEELFPSASYQYVYYGMGGHTNIQNNKKHKQEQVKAELLFQNNIKVVGQLLKDLPNNRTLLDKIARFGLSKI